MNEKIIGIIGIILFVYYALHSTPSLAVRTVLFFEGHPIVAFSGEVKKERDVKKRRFLMSTKPYMERRKKKQSIISFRQ